MNGVLSVRWALRLLLACAVAPATLAACAKRDSSPDELAAYKGVTLGMSKRDVFAHVCNGSTNLSFHDDIYTLHHSTCRSYDVANKDDFWTISSGDAAHCVDGRESVAITFTNGRVAKIERDCPYFWRN